MKTTALAGLGLLQVLPSAAEYVWPSKYDYMEDLLYLQSGYIRNGFRDGVTPCYFSSDGNHRQTAAEWLRTAYHDMSTHDAEAGTGGLDASIMFETMRDENIGDAFNATFGFASNYYDIRASAADLIALSAVVAVGACDGPKIPFRAGRIDATEAGPTGVPKPDQDVDTHKQIFAKAGFNTTDMITMVACGHTLGGVHGKDFPEITFDESETNFEHFEADESYSSFDNNIVTGYLNNTTPNMLAVGKNATTNSDARVFAADGNTTMKALADPQTFQSKCSDVLARMIDTVPAGVELSDVLDPIAVKPYITSFVLTNATHLTLTGRIRLHADQDTYADQAVHLTYTPRNPADGLNTTIPTTRAVFQMGTSSGLHGETFAWHEFETTLPTSSSISSFTVTVTRVSTGEETHYDNAATGGYPLDDTLLFHAPQSCLVEDTATKDYGLTVTTAVRTEALKAGKVSVELARKIPRQGAYLPKIEVGVLEEEAGAERKEVGEWTLVQVKGGLGVESLGTTFDVVVGEKRLVYQGTRALVGQVCAAL